jgi:hypothetical protein
VCCPRLLAEIKVATILGILVRAECVHCPWLLAENEGGHYFRYFSFSSFLLLLVDATIIKNHRRGLS